MEQRKQKLTNLFLFLLTATVLFGQDVKGRLLDKLNNTAIADALVKDVATGQTTFSDQEGNFILKL